MKGSPTIPVDISPWYRDTSSWLYLIGIGCTVGLAYFGYLIYCDPTIIKDYIPTPKVRPTNIPLPPSPDITLGDNTTTAPGSIVSSIGLAIFKPISYIKKMLNPFSYVTTSTEVNNQFQTFMNYHPLTQDSKLYPFTENNPFEIRKSKNSYFINIYFCFYLKTLLFLYLYLYLYFINK